MLLEAYRKKKAKCSTCTASLCTMCKTRIWNLLTISMSNVCSNWSYEHLQNTQDMVITHLKKLQAMTSEFPSISRFLHLVSSLCVAPSFATQTRWKKHIPQWVKHLRNTKNIALSFFRHTYESEKKILLKYWEWKCLWCWWFSFSWIQLITSNLNLKSHIIGYRQTKYNVSIGNRHRHWNEKQFQYSNSVGIGYALKPTQTWCGWGTNGLLCNRGVKDQPKQGVHSTDKHKGSQPPYQYKGCRIFDSLH